MDGIGVGFAIILFGPLVGITMFAAVIGTVISAPGKRQKGALRGLKFGLVASILVMPALLISPPGSKKEIPMIVEDCGPYCGV